MCNHLEKIDCITNCYLQPVQYLNQWDLLWFSTSRESYMWALCAQFMRWIKVWVCVGFFLKYGPIMTIQVLTIFYRFVRQLSNTQILLLAAPGIKQLPKGIIQCKILYNHKLTNFFRFELRDNYKFLMLPVLVSYHTCSGKSTHIPEQILSMMRKNIMHSKIHIEIY